MEQDTIQSYANALKSGDADGIARLHSDIPISQTAPEDSPVQMPIPTTPPPNPIANVDNPDGIALLRRPDPAATLVTALPHHAEVWLLGGESAKERLGQSGQWLHVQTPDGVTGYTPAQFLALPFIEETIAAAVNDQHFGVEDALDFKKYADAFHSLITHPNTLPPLTIGIYGTWGAGKSFLLNMIGEKLWGNPDIHIVSFNAWEYHTHEVVWSGLVRKIIDELERQIPLRARLKNRVVRNFQRQVRGLDWRITPYALIVLALLAFALYTTQGNFNQIVQIVSGLGGLIGLIALLRNVLTAPLSKWVVNLFARNEYGRAIGYMEDIKSDIEALEKLLPNAKIVIMIDDLDRCPPGKVVDVLEAIKLLLDYPIFIVFLGIDARVVTRTIEERYKGILKDIGTSGYEYLDKIVQIPFSIPRPSSDDIRNFLKKQFHPEDERAPAAPSAAQRGGEPIPAGDGGPPSSSSPGEDGEPSQPGIVPPTGVQPPPPETKVRRVPFKHEEERAFKAYAGYLLPNPRHIKRLLNTYRLIRSLAEDDPDLLENPRHLIKWLILSSQWPFTVQRMAWGYQIGFESTNMRARRDALPDDQAKDLAQSPLLRKLYWYRMGNPNMRGDDSLADLPREAAVRRSQLDANNDILLHLIDNETLEDAIDETLLRKLRRYATAFHPAIDESAWELIVADLESK